MKFQVRPHIVSGGQCVDIKDDDGNVLATIYEGSRANPRQPYGIQIHSAHINGVSWNDGCYSTPPCPAINIGFIPSNFVIAGDQILRTENLKELAAMTALPADALKQ